MYLKKEYIEKGGTHMQAKKIKPAKGQQFVHTFLTDQLTWICALTWVSSSE